MGKAPVPSSVPNEIKSSSSASVGSSQNENSPESFSHSLEISLAIISVLALLGLCIAFRKKIAGFFKKQDKAKNDETLKNVTSETVLEPKTEDELEDMLEPEPEENHELEDK